MYQAGVLYVCSMMERLKKFFGGDYESIDDYAKRLKSEIRELAPKIEIQLAIKGYTILSMDTRTFYYSYRICKDGDLMSAKEFSISELKDFFGIELSPPNPTK